VAAWQVVLGAFSNAPGSVPAAMRAAGSFDWVMHHDVPENSQVSSSSSVGVAAA
jgi:hypothetical protein